MNIKITRCLFLLLLISAYPLYGQADGRQLSFPRLDHPISTVSLAKSPLDSGGLALNTQATTIGGAWVSQGPGPSQQGGVDGIIDGEVSGAVHAIIAHPTDANIAWIGAVNGGVWKTTNARASKPTWVPQTDTEVSMTVGAMDLDPSDASFQTLVVGFGRYSSFGLEGGPLNGMLRSTDGGTTWTSLSNATINNQSCSGIAARGNTLLFSATDFFDGGVFRSTDTGVTWTKIDGATGSGLVLGPVFDLVGDPTSQSRFYLTSKTKGVYRSDDTGATWTLISDAGQVAVFAATDDSGVINNNAEMSVASDGRLYVAIINLGQAVSIEYSDNPEAATPTWVKMDIPSTPIGSGFTITDATNASPIVVTTSAAHGLKTGNFVQISGVLGNTTANGIYGVTVLTDTTLGLRLTTGNGAYTSGGSLVKVNGLNPRDKRGAQGAIHFSILADKNNSNILYVGGDSQQLDDNPNFIGADNFTGRLWRGDTTITATGGSPSPQWFHLTHSNAIAAISLGGTANSSSPHADSREMVMDANGEILQGDDGGIYRRTSPQTNTGDWFSINGDTVVSEQHNIIYDTVSNVIFSGTQDNGTILQQISGGAIWFEIGGGDGGDVAIDTTTAAPNSIRYLASQNNGGFSRQEYDANNGLVNTAFPELTGSGSWAPNFVTPTEVNTVTQSRLVLGGTNGIIESFDKGETSTYLVTDAINEGGLAYGANGKADVLYAAADDVVLVRLSGTGAPIATATAFPGTIIKDLVINPTDENTLYVVDERNVYMTTDAGATWSDITGDLTNGVLVSIEYISGTTKALAVAGTGGVFRMDVTQSGTWTNLGTGLPNVLIFDIDYDQVDDVLVVGTLGRGAWLLNAASKTATSAADADNDGVADATDNCPNNANADQLNTDGDSNGNACDTDDDNDGVVDTADAFPLDATETLDTDGDSIGNNADTDDDNDGILDVDDQFPLDATNTPVIPNRFKNIATRGFVGTGDNVLIGGLVITGTEPKTVIIRARGPALANAGVTGALTDPKITLFSGPTVIDSNDDYATHPNASQIPTELIPGDGLDFEAIIVKTLAPGAYTAIVEGVGGEEGIGLIEVFEASDTNVTRLINIATRGFVGTGDKVLIGGLVITGTGTKKIVIRAKGPSLTALGVNGALANPNMNLFSGANIIDSNNDWQDHARASEIPANLQPTDALESVIFTELAPGAYTVIVEGVGQTTGVGIVEVFEVQ